MKAKSHLSILAYSIPSEGVSIIEAARKVVVILKALGEIDPIFLFPVHINGKREKSVDVMVDGVEHVAQLILNTEWNEITKHEGEYNPTLNYRRVNGGFGFYAKCLVGKELAFYLNIGLGYSVDGIVIRDFNRSIEYPYDWYKELLYKIVDTMNPFFATVKLDNLQSNKFYKKMNIEYPIGWITYFSDSLKYLFPKKIEETRIDHKEDGLFLITSEEDFMKNKEVYLSNREKLERIISIIKYHVPDLIKQNTSL